VDPTLCGIYATLRLVFLMSEGNLQLGLVSHIPSKIYCHALALGVGFSDSEETLLETYATLRMLSKFCLCPRSFARALLLEERGGGALMRKNTRFWCLRCCPNSQFSCTAFKIIQMIENDLEL
jgi:hypothetical protein